MPLGDTRCNRSTEISVRERSICDSQELPGAFRQRRRVVRHVRVEQDEAIRIVGPADGPGHGCGPGVDAALDWPWASPCVCVLPADLIQGRDDIPAAPDQMDELRTGDVFPDLGHVRQMLRRLFQPAGASPGCRIAVSTPHEATRHLTDRQRMERFHGLNFQVGQHFVEEHPVAGRRQSERMTPAVREDLPEKMSFRYTYQLRMAADEGLYEGGTGPGTAHKETSHRY